MRKKETEQNIQAEKLIHLWFSSVRPPLISSFEFNTNEWKAKTKKAVNSWDKRITEPIHMKSYKKKNSRNFFALLVNKKIQLNWLHDNRVRKLERTGEKRTNQRKLEQSWKDFKDQWHTH